MFVFGLISGRQIDLTEPAPRPRPKNHPQKTSTDPDPDQRNVWSCGAASRASTRVMDGDGIGGGGNFFFFKGVWGIFLFLYGGGGGKDLSKAMRRGFAPNPRLRWGVFLAPFGLCITLEQCRPRRHSNVAHDDTVVSPRTTPTEI